MRTHACFAKYTNNCRGIRLIAHRLQQQSAVAAHRDRQRSSDQPQHLSTPSSKRARPARGVLNQLIQSDLIDQYATENHIDPTSAQINDELNKLKARYPNGQFDAIVKQKD